MDNNQKTITDLLQEKELTERKLSAADDLIDYYRAKSKRLSEENEKLKDKIQQLKSKNEDKKIMHECSKKRLIELFNQTKELEKQYDDLSKEFDRAINYIKMMKNFNNQ